MSTGVLGRRLPEWWFAEVPARRVQLVRSVTFGYAAVWLTVRAGYVWDLAALPQRRFEPVGVLTVLDAAPTRAVVIAVWAVTVTATVLAACGRALRFAAPVGAAGTFLIATLTASFGQIFHTEHLLVLHLLILAAAVVVPVDGPRAGSTSGWPLQLMMCVVVVAYVVAGVAKLRLGGGDWVSGDVLRNWVAADNLRKVLLDDPHSPVGGWLAGVAWVWPPIATVTLAVELGAPLALFPGRVRLAWLGLAWGFHVAVLALMAIMFPYQLFGVAYLAFLPAERIEERVRSWCRGVSPRSTPSTTRGGLRRGATTD